MSRSQTREADSRRASGRRSPGPTAHDPGAARRQPVRGAGAVAFRGSVFGAHHGRRPAPGHADELLRVPGGHCALRDPAGGCFQAPGASLCPAFFTPLRNRRSPEPASGPVAADAGGAGKRAQPRIVALRVAARDRPCADVDEGLDTGAPKQRDEVIDRERLLCTVVERVLACTLTGSRDKGRRRCRQSEAGTDRCVGRTARVPSSGGSARSMEDPPGRPPFPLHPYPRP